jgi:hypothetical protein
MRWEGGVKGWGCIREVSVESRINISIQKKNSESMKFKLFEAGDRGVGEGAEERGA